MLHIVQVFDVR